MARRKRKLKKKFLASIIVFLVVVVGGIYMNYKKENNESTPNTNENINKKDEVKEDEVYKISMLATGDALIHNAIFWEYSTGDKNTGPFNFDGALDYVRDIVSEYDIAYYNQETPIAGGTPSGYPRFSTPSEFGDAMIKAGFNMISTATNHTIDKGENGIINFYNYLKEQDDIVYN